MADLEDLERAGTQTVIRGVEQAAEPAGERVVIQTIAKLVVLEGVDEIRKSARRARREKLQRAVEGLALSGRGLDALQGQEHLQPFLRPHTIRERLERREWIEGQRTLTLTKDVVVLGAARVGEYVGRVVLVKEEHLRAGIPEELGHKQPDQRRLARARGPEDERVADVAHVEVQSEGCGASGRRVEQRGAALR